MAFSTQRAVSDGTMAYLDISIQYIKRADINVFYDGLPANPATWAWVGTTDKRIAFTPNVPNHVEVLIKRTTQIDGIINVFSLGAKFNNSTMDQDFTQLLYLNQEAVEGAALTDIFNDVDFHGYKIKNLGLAVDDTDAITFGQLKTMSTGAYNAQIAAQAAQAASEAARDLAQKWASQLTTTVDGTSYSAKQYALNASASATAASGSASAASGSATAAAGSAAAAQTARLGAESARDDAVAAGAPATALIARVDAVEVVANNASSTAAAATTTANSALTAAGLASVGQCRLVFVSSTQIKLQRYDGQYVIINGSPQSIPAAGVTISNTGLVAGTLYYCYVYMSGATMALELSTTAYTTHTNGITIKNGDATRTLVGMVYAGTSAIFRDNTTDCHVLSYFNRRVRSVQGTTNSGGSFTNTTATLIGSGLSLLAWGGECFISDAACDIANNNGTSWVRMGIAWDGVVVGSNGFYQAFTNNAAGMTHAHAATDNVSPEGLHQLRNAFWCSSGTGTIGTCILYTWTRG